MKNIHFVRSICRGCLPALTALMFFYAVVLLADTNYVVPPGTAGVTPTPAYLSWDTAATNIQEAVTAATNGNTVLVTNGSYCVTNQVQITKAITVQSMGGWTNTLVYADWPAWTTRCFYVANTGAVLDGFTASNGHYIGNSATGGGGGGLYHFLRHSSELLFCEQCLFQCRQLRIRRRGQDLWHGDIVELCCLFKRFI